jgi:predicted  nucleic acid-binding Zn-ribbon protein
VWQKAGVTLRRMSTDDLNRALTRLLDLQAEDSEIRRLIERKASLPEARRLAEVNAGLAELESDLAMAVKQRDEIDREQARLEDEMSLLDGKIEKEEGRLFSGSVANPRELGALQAEVGMLKRQKSGLEDELLEVMVQKEGATETVARLTSERDGAAAEATRLTAGVNELTAELDGHLVTHNSNRLRLYDRLREQKNGVGAAALEGGTCQGCHTKLPAKEVERVRGERGLQRCDNCRRILVAA